MKMSIIFFAVTTGLAMAQVQINLEDHGYKEFSTIEEQATYIHELAGKAGDPTLKWNQELDMPEAAIVGFKLKAAMFHFMDMVFENPQELKGIYRHPIFLFGVFRSYAMGLTDAGLFERAEEAFQILLDYSEGTGQYTTALFQASYIYSAKKDRQGYIRALERAVRGPHETDLLGTGEVQDILLSASLLANRLEDAGDKQAAYAAYETLYKLALEYQYTPEGAFRDYHRYKKLKRELGIERPLVAHPSELAQYLSSRNPRAFQNLKERMGGRAQFRENDKVNQEIMKSNFKAMEPRLRRIFGK